MLVPLHSAASALFVLLSNCVANKQWHSAPHPSENHIQIRVQMYGMRSLHLLPGLCIPTSFLDHLSSLTALLRALDDLDALFESIEDAYKASLMHDKIVLWDERR